MPKDILRINKVKTKTGFSIFELSIVVLIVSFLAVGAIQGGEIIRKAKVASAASATKTSVVGKIDGLAVWYETTMPTSFDDAQAADGVAISSWKDISDISTTPQNAIQNTATNQPIYVTNSINGLPAVRFDGVDNFLQTTISPIKSSKLEVFTVCKRVGIKNNASTATFYQNGLSNDFDNTSSFVLAYESSGTILQTLRVAGKSYATHPGNGVPYIFSTRFDGVNNTSYLNGVAQASAASAGSFNIDRILMGARFNGGATLDYYSGDIGELIVFNRALTNQERQDIEQYLGKKWGIIVP